jgi:hypothetical protein
MSYTVNDKRGQSAPSPVCRVCGSSKEHSNRYGTPTVECVEFLRAEISSLRKENDALKASVQTQQKVENGKEC